MKSLVKITTIATVTIGLLSCNGLKKDKDASLNDLRDSASYCLGLSVATNLAQDKLDSLNLDAFIAGYMDAKDPESYKIAVAEITNTIQNFAMQEIKIKYSANIEAGKKFLEENKKRAGVTTTASGLQYEVISMGTGAKPQMYDSVTVNYHGTKLDGSVFDSSKGANPVTLSLTPGKLIQGWVEGMTLFPVGSKFKLYVPENLAYGVNARGSIQPYETLIFEVELLATKKGEAPKMDMNAMQQMMGN